MFAGPVPCKALFITARMVTPQPASRTPKPRALAVEEKEASSPLGPQTLAEPLPAPAWPGPRGAAGVEAGLCPGVGGVPSPVGEQGWAPAQSPGDSGSMWPGWETTGRWRGNFQGDGACAAARAAPVEPGGDDGFLEGRTTNGPGGGKGTPCGAGDQPCACASEGYRRARARV